MKSIRAFSKLNSFGYHDYIYIYIYLAQTRRYDLYCPLTIPLPGVKNSNASYQYLYQYKLIIIDNDLTIINYYDNDYLSINNIKTPKY